MKTLGLVRLLLILVTGCAGCVCYHPELASPKEQEAIFRKQVETADRQGLRDARTASALNNLGMLCMTSGRTAEAETCFLRSARIESSLAVPHEKNLAITYDN